MTGRGICDTIEQCFGLAGFALVTGIYLQRQCLSVFLSRRKKNSEKERPLRGFRREVRFIMSPPGKRRHNELNAAPPPETPQGTGATGSGSDGDGVHCGKRCRIQAKPVSQLSARHDSAAIFFGFSPSDVMPPIKTFPSTLLCYCSSAVNPLRD